MKGARAAALVVLVLLLGAVGLWALIREDPCVTVSALRRAYSLNRPENRYNLDAPVPVT